MEKRSDIMNSVIVFVGIIFLGFSIIYAANTLKPTLKDEGRYQIVQLNEANIAVIDHQTGKIYYKFIAPNEGPTNWQEMVMPE